MIIDHVLKFLEAYNSRIVSSLIPQSIGFSLNSDFNKCIISWRNPQLSKLNRLINNWQDINHVGPDGLTPLNIAERYGKIEYAELFIKHGVSPNNIYFKTIEILNMKEDSRYRNYKIFDLTEDTILIKLDMTETIEKALSYQSFDYIVWDRFW